MRTLVGPDEDAHAFQPRPSDAREIGSAYREVLGREYGVAMTAVQVAGLIEDRAKVEIEVTAYRGAGKAETEERVAGKLGALPLDFEAMAVV